MSERLGVRVWERGLGEGYSIKDAFDNNRPYFESLGLAWPFNQVGIHRVRTAGQLVPPMYVGYRLAGRINSGPVEYMELYKTMWPTFTTAGSQVRYHIFCLYLLQQFAEYLVVQIKWVFHVTLFIGECSGLQE